MPMTTAALLTVAGCSSPSSMETHSSPAAVSLAGEWRFALDRADTGITEKWFERDLADRIKLPGTLQAQGFGDEITPNTPWAVTLGDAWWKLQPESLREKFSQPGHVEVPFLSQPPRHYLGAAWYQREIEIPAAGLPKRFVLFLERAHWETTVWVDDKAYPANNSLVAPHSTDLGVLAPGRHRLTIRADNRQIVRDPVFDNHGLDGHSVTDAMGATWNGIVGRIELQATPTVWLEDVQVLPNLRAKSARVRVRVGNVSGAAGKGTLTAGNESREITWTNEGGVADLDIQLGADAATWDEFHPALQHVTATLTVGESVDRRTVTFGLREVSWRDKDFLVNGRSTNLRTTHFGGDFPLTGYPATDVESWRRIIRRCQEFGMNGIRFHSWCPPEAAFVAADELGFYLQPECGLWAPFYPHSPYTLFLQEETPRLLKAFGNHPSFVLLSPSNEPAGRYRQITPKWASDWYEQDPRRLYSAGTGWSAREQVTDGAQYAALVRYETTDLRNEDGWFGADYRAAMTNIHIPVFAHEVGQWCAYPDFDVIKEFTGFMQPGNYRIFRYIAEQTGVLADNHALAWSSGRFQLACYKEDIEANLRTPGLAGYQLLDLRDYLGQGTALIGVLDAFWQPKRYVTAAEFRRFNDTTVPLARLSRRTFSTDETLEADLEIYHFGERPIQGVKPYWKLVRFEAGTGTTGDTARRGEVVAEGELTVRDIPIGKNIALGKLTLDLAKLPAPAAYKLVVGLTGTKVANEWNVWVYPSAKAATPAPSDVLVTSTWTEATVRLAAGGKVLYLPKPTDLDPQRSPKMHRTPVFWNIQMTVRPPKNPTPEFDGMLGLLCEPGHPALAGFPTEVNCDWQWTPLIDGVPAVNLNDAPRGLRPIVATIDDWNRNWRLGVIFECRVGAGRLVVSTIDLNQADASAGRLQLKRSLLSYMAGERFAPATTLTAEQADDLWKKTAAGDVPRARVFDPDLDDGRHRRTEPPSS